MVGGVIVVFAVPMLDKLKIDDVVGAIPVHLIAGIWARSPSSLPMAMRASGFSFTVSLWLVSLPSWSPVSSGSSSRRSLAFGLTKKPRSTVSTWQSLVWKPTLSSPTAKAANTQHENRVRAGTSGPLLLDVEKGIAKGDKISQLKGSHASVPAQPFVVSKTSNCAT